MGNRIQDYASEQRRDSDLRQPRGSSSDEIRRVLQNRFNRWMGDMEHYLADHPRTCIMVGLAAGVYFGWLIKRR